MKLCTEVKCEMLLLRCHLTHDNPRILEDIFAAGPVRRRGNQQLADQILDLVVGRRPRRIAGWELEGRVLDAVDQVLVVGTGEGQLAAHHHVQQHADAPHVHGEGVRVAQQRLGGHERHIVPLEQRVVAEHFERPVGHCQREVADHHLEDAIACALDHDVVSCEAAHDDALGVAVAGGAHNRPNDLASVGDAQFGHFVLEIHEVLQSHGVDEVGDGEYADVGDENL